MKYLWNNTDGKAYPVSYYFKKNLIKHKTIKYKYLSIDNLIIFDLYCAVEYLIYECYNEIKVFFFPIIFAKGVNPMKLKLLKICVAIILCISLLTIVSCAWFPTATKTDAITTISTEDNATSTQYIDVNDYVTYTYSDDITETEKILFEQENEIILEYLIRNDILTDQTISYYISRETYPYYDSVFENLWLYIEDYASKDNIFNTIIAISDPMANYGLMYGLANHITKELGYDYQEPVNTVSSMLTFLASPTNIDYFDITYPCFLEAYSTGTQREYSYEFAIRIAEFIINNFGISAIMDLLNGNDDLNKFETDFSEYKNLFLLDNGFDLVLDSSEHPIIFLNEYIQETLEWKTEHANWVVHNGFVEPSLYLANYSVNSNYTTLVYAVTKLEEDMDYLDSILKLDGFEYTDLTIHFDSNSPSLGFYSGGYIFLESLYALAHEYVHYLTTPTLDAFTTKAMHEWLACYFSYNTYFVKYVNQRIINNYSINDQSFITLFEYHYGRDFSYEDDYFKYVHIYQYERGNYADINTYNESYFSEYYSFPAYFVEIYGADALIAIMRDISLLDDYTGKTWDEIYQDWETYVVTTYSWVS